MSSTNEVEREYEGELSEATANEKFLYSRVLELEKRNQKLEKKVKKLKKKKKELKEEVAKLRGAVPVQYGTDDHDASTSDVEVVEEPNIGSSQSKGWGLSVKLGKHSAIWGKLGTALQAYTLNPCTKFPPNPTKSTLEE